MTSSILRVIAAASEADLITCCLTLRGSRTFSFRMSFTSPEKTSIPNHGLPARSCFDRSSTRTALGSNPAFSASVVGTASRDSAKASIASCSLPPTFTAYSRSLLASSASGAPPPATILPSSNAFLTTHSASCSDLSASSTTCSVPPRMTIVTAFGFLASRTYRSLSSPILTSSTDFASPKESFARSLTLATTLAPVAFDEFCFFQTLAVFFQDFDQVYIGFDLAVNFLGNLLDGLHRDVCEVFFRDSDALAVHGCCRDLSQNNIIFLSDRN